MLNRRLRCADCQIHAGVGFLFRSSTTERAAGRRQPRPQVDATRFGEKKVSRRGEEHEKKTRTESQHQKRQGNRKDAASCFSSGPNFLPPYWIYESFFWHNSPSNTSSTRTDTENLDMFFDLTDLRLSPYIGSDSVEK